MSADPKTTTLAALRTTEQVGPPVAASLTDSSGWALIQRVANALSQSTLVPQQFQSNIPNCIIALEMAQRIGASPLMVCQNLYVVHGRPGWSAKFLIASFNQCGRFSAIRYEWVGTRGKDDWGCRAYATEKATGERITGPLITIALAKQEGWYEKSGSKWKTIPELMLCYRAAAWMVNTHAPEISMGLNTQEELGDTFDAQPVGDGGYAVTTETLREIRDAEPPAQVAEPAPEPEPPKAPRKPKAAPEPDEAKVLRDIDTAPDAECAAIILDGVRGTTVYASAETAFKARWVKGE